MSDTTPIPPASERELIEKAALHVGMKSLMNHGAASCVYSEGCNGVTQDHLIAFAREIALHCAAALSHPSTPQGWQPIESAPEGTMILCANMKAMEARDWCYVAWIAGNRVCGSGVAYPTHWMPLPPPPEQGGKG